MSTTNNQSIQQINTAALRGTREAHQPDVFQLQHPLTMEESMNQTEATLNFDTIELTGDGYAKTTQLNGNEWKTYLWEYSSRGLMRNVPGGEASISESSNGKFMVRIEVQPCVARARLEKTFWGTLLEAVEFAETFTWEIKEHAG